MEKKLVTINTSGVIRELEGGICGPVLTPVYISIPTIRRMVYAGKKVYEVNPANRNERIRLTKENVGKKNFGKIVQPPPVDFSPKPAPGYVPPVVKEEVKELAILPNEDTSTDTNDIFAVLKVDDNIRIDITPAIIEADDIDTTGDTFANLSDVETIDDIPVSQADDTENITLVHIKEDGVETESIEIVDTKTDFVTGTSTAESDDVKVTVELSGTETKATSQSYHNNKKKKNRGEFRHK